ncbi:MAG: hypothetical protein WA215_07775 [Candidatus Cybelea sp.]
MPSTTPYCRAVILLAVGAIAAGCAPHVAFALSKDDQARFQDGVLRVPVQGHGQMIFGLNNCIVYKAKTARDDIVGWSVVLASDWGQSSYPKWATVCTSERIRYTGKYVVVDFCAQAIGAGGGCAGGGGTYRSHTGDAQGWQIQADKGWITLPRS